MVDTVKALLELELAKRRAESYRKRLHDAALAVETDAWFRKHDMMDDEPVMDTCLAGHNTMPEQMAWPERYQETLIDWDAFDAQWVYNRSLRVYEKLDATLYAHWATA